MLRGGLKTDSVRVSVTYPPVFGVTRTFKSFSDISKEVNDGRVWVEFTSAAPMSTAMNSVGGSARLFCAISAPPPAVIDHS